MPLFNSGKIIKILKTAGICCSKKSGHPVQRPIDIDWRGRRGKRLQKVVVLLYFATGCNFIIIYWKLERLSLGNIWLSIFENEFALSNYELLQRYFSKIFHDFRNSCSQVFYNIEKHLCQIIFPDSPACSFIKKEAPAQGFSCEFFRNFTELLRGFWWLLLSTFLKYLDGCSSTWVAQKFFFQRFLSTSFLYKEEVGEKEGLGWIFLEELLKCLNKHPTFVYIPLLTVNVWRRVLR